MEFDFEANGTVESIDTVPEKYRGLYAEGADDNAGKHILSDAAKGLVADYLGVSKTLAGVRVDKKKVGDENAERRIATKAVDDFAASIGLDVGDDGVVVALKTFVEDLQGQVKGGKEIKINLDKVQAEADKRVATVTETKDAELTDMRGALHKHLISDAASRALAEHKGSMDLLLPHVVNACKVVRNPDTGEYAVTVLDDEGASRFDSAGGLMGVAGLVAEMKTKEKFERAFDSEAKPGTGAKPGSMNRPVMKTGAGDRELSPTEKIRIGLQKGQAKDGRGGTTA